MRNVPAPSPRSMWARTGATAAPRETIASARAMASATSTGSRAKISSRVKCLYTRFLADAGQRLEQLHRLLATRDGKLEDEVPDAKLRHAPEVRDHLLAKATEWSAAGDRELIRLPSLLRGRLGDAGPVACNLEACAHRHPISLISRPCAATS